MTTPKRRLSSAEREKRLVHKIEMAKKELSILHENRKKEIGKLAYKHGLHLYDNDALDIHLRRLAKELKK